jgi:hypothetical protein
MPVDHIRYDVLVQQALRGMVRSLLTDIAKKGLPGEHHFYITFDTTAEGVQMSDRLREQYPEEMTIVLQHQFWDLKVSQDAFEVGLSFGGVPERLFVPLEAITKFADPAVQFALQFEMLTEEADDADTETGAAEDATAKTRPSRARPARADAAAPGAPAAAADAGSAADKPQVESGEKQGAEVVRLDRFRKK